MASAMMAPARPMLPKRALKRSPPTDDFGLWAASPALSPTAAACFAPYRAAESAQEGGCVSFASTSASSSAGSLAARRAIDVCVGDLAFWKALLQHEEALAFLAKTLKAKAQRDASFARLVLACRPGGLTPSPCPFGDLATPAQRLGLIAEEAATPSRCERRARKRGAAMAMTVAPAGQPQPGATAAAACLPASMADCLNRRAPASAPPRATALLAGGGADKFAAAAAASRRNLFCDFEFDEGELGDAAATPAKCPKREAGSSRRNGRTPGAAVFFPEVPPMPVLETREGSESQLRDADADADCGELLPSLPPFIAAVVAGLLPVPDKLQLAVACRGAAPVLEQQTAWEPLILDRRHCGGLLRRLRRHDPMGVLPPAEYPVPAGLLQVSELRIELMEPDSVATGCDAALSEPPPQTTPSPTSASAWGGRTPGSQRRRLGGATPGGSPRFFAAATPGPRFGSVLDPLDELCRRLRRGWFSSARRVEISNVEDHRMDYHFLLLRGSVFGGFPHVRVEMTSAGRYALLAQRGEGAPPLPRADIKAAHEVSAARQPPEAPLLLPPPEGLSSLEAMFLEEHSAVFKSGDSFHFAHAPWRSYPGETVRQRYQAVLDLLSASAGA